MKIKDNKESYEYVYLEIPIMPPIKKKEEKQKEVSSIIIDLNEDNGIEIVDFNIL